MTSFTQLTIEILAQERLPLPPFITIEQQVKFLFPFGFTCTSKMNIPQAVYCLLDNTTPENTLKIKQPMVLYNKRFFESLFYVYFT